MSLPRRVGRWQLDRLVAPAAEIHGRDLPDDGRPRAWLAEATTAALVLGSSQSPEIVDVEAATRHGLDVVRRRSGGGAVLVVPRDLVWIDVIVPRGDRLWDDDIGRAAHWLGHVWADAIRSFGQTPHVHQGAMRTDALGRAVCFASRGPGEVVASAAIESPKFVGISQRRTRAGVRFQCAALLRWDPAPLESLLPGLLSRGDMGRLEQAGTGVAGSGPDLVDSFLAELGRR